MVLATANGMQSLSIPVDGGRNQRALYRDIRIDYQGDWQIRHWRSIFSAYGKSPWFFQYADSLEAVYRHRDQFLVDWNVRCLHWVSSALRLPPGAPLVLALGNPDAGWGKHPPDASAVHPPGLTRSPGPGIVREQGPVIDLSNQVTPANFQDARFGPFPRYPQVFEERWGFLPNLSVLDLIFCCGPGAPALLEQVSTPVDH
jgi:hypothetical protein